MDISQVKKGDAVVYQGQKWIITKLSFVNPGKGSSFYPTKLKSLATGNVIEANIKTSESIQIADVFYHRCQYLYADATNYYFMNTSDYNQFNVPLDVLGESGKFLQEEKEYEVMFIDGNAANVVLPPKVVLKVAEASEATRGDTSTNATKDVKLENGMQIRVPLFIKQGEKVRISTEDGSYCERVNE